MTWSSTADKLPAVEMVWERKQVRRGQLKASSGLVCVRSLDGLVALDTATGDQLWSTDSEYCHDVEDHLVVDEKVVLVSEGERGLRAISAESGETAWRFETAYLPCFVTHRESVLVACGDGDLLGLDRHTGELRWTSFIDEKPGAVGAGDGVFVVRYESSAVGFASVDGSELWRVDICGWEAPAIEAGVAVLRGSADPESQLVAVALADGAELWRSPSAPWKRARIGHGLTFVVGRETRLTALKADTGSERWQASEFLGWPPCVTTESVVMVDGVPSERTCQLVELDPQSGEVRWVGPETASLVTGPTGADARLYAFPHNDDKSTGNVVCWRP